MKTIRKAYAGQDYSKVVKRTQPNQSMSLQTILERFTRNEPLSIGKDVSYSESEDDLEKLIHLDPVDRAAYIRKMQEVQDKYNQQQADALKKMQEEERKKFLRKLEDEHEEASRPKKKRGASPPPAK